MLKINKYFYVLLFFVLVFLVSKEKVYAVDTTISENGYPEISVIRNK